MSLFIENMKILPLAYLLYDQTKLLSKEIVGDLDENCAHVALPDQVVTMLEGVPRPGASLLLCAVCIILRAKFNELEQDGW